VTEKNGPLIFFFLQISWGSI